MIFGKVELVGDKLVVTCEPHVSSRAKRVFAKISPSSHGGFSLSNNPENAYDLRWFLTRYPMDVDPPGVLDAGAQLYETCASVLDEMKSPNFVPAPFEMALPAREYQRYAAEMLLRSKSLLLADDVGTGKTVSAIATLTDPSTRPALVVTLTHLPEQWRKELARFLPGVGCAIPRHATPHRMTVSGALPDVIVTSYSKLSGWADFLAGKIKSVIFDEVQELRSDKTARYKAALHIAGQADYRMGLSATPIYNYGGEIFTVLNVLKPGALGFDEEFMREWCCNDFGAFEGVGRARVRDPQALGAHLRDRGLMLRRTRKDVGREIPPITRVVHTIDIDVAELEKIEGDASKLARIILEKQGTSFQQMQAAEELNAMVRKATGVAKAPYVAEFVRLLVESGEKVLLYGWHRDVYAIWAEKLKDLGIVFYTGHESVKEKEESKNAFVHGSAKVLAMSLRSGAGVDGIQHACRTVVFGELDWSGNVHEQNIGRPARDGQTDPVCAYFLVSDSGSDPIVMDVVGVKMGQSDGIRDPHGAVISDQVDPGRMKRLAEYFLAGIKSTPKQTKLQTLDLFSNIGTP